MQAFCREVPGSVSTLARRLRTVGTRLPRPSRPAPGSVRAGTVEAALRSVQVDGWPGGLPARRDAAVVALVAVGGLTRRQVRGLRASWPPVLASSGDPGSCPACAETRWRRALLVGLADGWRQVRYELTELEPATAAEHTWHDCERPLPPVPDLAAAAPLAVAVDRHGWADERRPLSARSISAIVSRRLAGPGPEPGPSRYGSEPGPRPRRADTGWDLAAGVEARKAAVERLERLVALLDRFETDESE